jgi:hypothetical protein
MSTWSLQPLAREDKRRKKNIKSFEKEKDFLTKLDSNIISGFDNLGLEV